MALDFGLFCAVMGGGPFIVIKLHFSRTRARIIAYLTKYPAAPIAIKPAQSVGWVLIGSY